MSKLMLPLLLLLVTFVSAQTWPWEDAHDPYTKYQVQSHYRYDGYAQKVNGGPSFSTTGSAVAVQFYKTFVVDGYNGNGTDAQVVAFRQNAVKFYQDRYGIIFPNPLPADPAAMLVLKYPNGTDSDSVIMPILLDRSMQSRVLSFVVRKQANAFPAAENYDCGWYLFVGPNGYPYTGAGSFGKALPPGGAGAYGVQAIHNVCPTMHKYCKSCCKGNQGQLLMNVMTQEILTPAVDDGWAVGNNSTLDQLGPAFKIPIQISIHHKDFGSGLCSGGFYAVPHNTTAYSLLHNAGCFFPPPRGYPDYPLVLAFH